MRCGREPGGKNVRELGVCPAASEIRLDGVNGGKNGGRACWAIAGTMCGKMIQGSFAQKEYSCLHCSFFKIVREEEGLNIVGTPAIMKILNGDQDKH